MLLAIVLLMPLTVTATQQEEWDAFENDVFNSEPVVEPAKIVTLSNGIAPFISPLKPESVEHILDDSYLVIQQPEIERTYESPNNASRILFILIAGGLIVGIPCVLISSFITSLTIRPYTYTKPACAKNAKAVHRHQANLRITYVNKLIATREAEENAERIRNIHLATQQQAELIAKKQAELIAKKHAELIAKKHAEALRPIHAVYIIEVNDEKYYGVSNNYQRRWNQHLGDLAAHTHCNYKLQKLYDNGLLTRKSFRLMAEGLTKHEAYAIENALCPERNTGLNIQVGGM